MTNRNSNLREKYLDGETLFRKYYEMGDNRSIKLLTEWAKVEGIKSSKGNEPTGMGIWKAMWRWASMRENKDLAWSIMKHDDLNLGYDAWKNQMIYIRIPSAWQHPNNAKLQKFLRENGWVE